MTQKILMLHVEYSELRALIKIQGFEGVEGIEKTDYETLLEEIKAIDGFTTHELLESRQGRKIYGFSYGDTNKNTLYIQGQIHGSHEWRTTHWVKKFMEILSDPQGLPQSHIINDLKARYSFYFIPCVNPDGYMNSTYVNAEGVAIDKNFDYNWDGFNPSPHEKGSAPFSEPEAKNIKNVVESIKPVSFVCCHTWGGADGMKIRRSSNPSYEVITVDQFHSSSLTSGVGDREGTRLESSISQPTAYNWAGTQTSQQGRKIIASVLETGSQETGYEQSRLGLNGLLTKCIYVDNYLTNQTLTIH